MVPTQPERILPYITPEAVARHSKLVLLHVVDTPESMTSLNIPGSPAVPVSTSGAAKRTFTEETAADNYLQPARSSEKKNWKWIMWRCPAPPARRLLNTLRKMNAP